MPGFMPGIPIRDGMVPVQAGMTGTSPAMTIQYKAKPL
jgi:hypothetical protein